jgi:hypothetical protein
MYFSQENGWGMVSVVFSYIYSQYDQVHNLFMYSTPPESQIERASTLLRLTSIKLSWKRAARMLPAVRYIFCLLKRYIKGTVARDLPMQLNGPTRCVEKYNRFAAAVHY